MLQVSALGDTAMIPAAAPKCAAAVAAVILAAMFPTQRSSSRPAVRMRGRWHENARVAGRRASVAD
eukprot:366131-Chlamydomonas_euryale.AAC.18